MNEYSVIEATMNLLLRGGWVLAPLFLLGWIGWFLLFERFGYYFMLKGRSTAAFFKDLNSRGEELAFERLRRRRFGYFLALVEDIRKHRDEGPVAVRNAMEATRHRIGVNLSKSLKQ